MTTMSLRRTKWNYKIIENGYIDVSVRLHCPLFDDSRWSVTGAQLYYPAECRWQDVLTWEHQCTIVVSAMHWTNSRRAVIEGVSTFPYNVRDNALHSSDSNSKWSVVCSLQSDSLRIVDTENCASEIIVFRLHCASILYELKSGDNGWHAIQWTNTKANMKSEFMIHEMLVFQSVGPLPLRHWITLTMAAEQCGTMQSIWNQLKTFHAWLNQTLIGGRSKYDLLWILLQRQLSDSLSIAF